MQISKFIFNKLMCITNNLNNFLISKMIFNFYQVNLAKATLIMDDSFSTSAKSGSRILLDENNPVSCWNETFNINNKNVVVDVCIAPVLVCTKASQTVGGGDNISSAGLVLQI